MGKILEDIYVVESGESSSESQVENFWQQLSEAEAFAEAKIASDERDFQRNKNKEDDAVVRYWESGDSYICIRLTVVD